LVGLHSAYLTGRQLDIWDLMRRGLSQSDIARGLNITRQAVNQLVETIPERVTSALSDASKLNGVEPRYIDSAKGILVGWSNEFQTKVAITLEPKEGLRVWYQHNLGRCKFCPDRRHCKSRILRTITALGVDLSREERNLEPSKLASLAFSRAIGRDESTSRAR